MFRIAHLTLPAILVVSTACGSSSDGGAGSPAQVGAGGSSSSTEPDASDPPATGACALTFTFTTVDNGGRYSPANVSAVWVTDAAGGFVRTLEENGFRRESHLVAWQTESGGSTVDAVTGATNRAPRAHEATWDCTATGGAEIAPGTYSMNAEFTTSNTGGFLGGPAPLLRVPFEVGSGPVDLAPPNEPLFVSISLTLR